jgi:3-oxoacyl-[acyl-carrier protein] reductase
MRRTRKPSTHGLHRPVVWVTGASRGIGREIARRFSSIGCIVALTSRSAAQLKSLRQEIESEGGRAESFPCDIANQRSVMRTKQRILASFGTIDVLVNNAGITAFKSFHNTSLREFDDIISVNLRGSIGVIKAVYDHMRRRKVGWIVNIISTAATRPFIDSSAYSVTKAGVRSLGQVLREESREYNIRVTNIYPGPTATSMWGKRERVRYKRRMMSPSGVAETVLALFLLPEDVVVEELVLRPIQGDLD